MRLALRSILAALSVAALASCTDASQGTSPAGTTRASLAIAPRFSPTAANASATLAEAGLEFDHVRIVIVRPATDTLKDTTIVFTPSSPAITLELSVPAVPAEELIAGVEFTQNGAVLFSGKANVTAVGATQSVTATPVVIDVDYTGPGAAATKVAIQPGSGLYSAVSTTAFTAKAFDAGNTELANTPIFWSVSDENLATISAGGVLTPKGNRGTLRVRALSANGVKDSVTVELAPAATGLRVVQGAGQTGSPGFTLPLPVIIEVIGPDGLASPAPGLTATFTASGGAQIAPATVTFDASGHAQATMKLGTTPGTTYIYTVNAGAFSVSWGATASVGAPTHFVAENGTSFSFKAGATPNPIPKLRVADAVENSVPNVILKVTAKKNGNLLTTTTVPADSIGSLEVYKTPVTEAGSYTILVETNDPSLGVPAITFNITIEPATATKLAFTTQPSSVTANQPMTPAVVVTVQDAYGNTVTTANGPIGIAVDPATGSGVAQVGTGSANAVNGVATYTNLRFDKPKTGIKITAAGFSLPAVLSAAFNVIP